MAISLAPITFNPAIAGGDPQAAQAAQSGSVKITANLCTKSLATASQPAQTLAFPKKPDRYSMYALRAMAGSLSGQKRITECSTRPAFGNAGRPGYIPARPGSAIWRGLANCQSCNVCPSCAALRARENTMELEALLHQVKKDGYFPLLVTPTLSHKRTDSLDGLYEHLDEMWINLYNTRYWRKLKKIAGYAGAVTATEVTWGQSNGWHPHYHSLFILKDQGEVRNAQIISEITAYLKHQWECEAERKHRALPHKIHGITVIHGDNAAAYIAKMGLSSELASAVTKSGRKGHYTQWQLLHAAMPDTPEAIPFRGRFAEYAKTFRRKNMLRYTPGLRAKFNVQERLDELQKAEQAEQSKPENKVVDIMVCTAMEMRAICARKAHQRILDTINANHREPDTPVYRLRAAVRETIDLIVFEYINQIRKYAGLRPLTCSPQQLHKTFNGDAYA